MRWTPERSQKADKHIEQTGHVLVPVKDWKLLRKIHSDITAHTANVDLQNPLRMSMLLTEIELAQLPDHEDWLRSLDNDH